MYKLFYYLFGYYQLTCPCCKKNFLIEITNFRNGVICCSVRCMYDYDDIAKLNVKV